MNQTPLRYLILLASCLLLGGCAGSLDIWGISICVDGTAPPCDGGTDDDDDVGPGLDLSVFDGVEWLNIEWSPEAIGDGHTDCKEAWEAEGVDDTENSVDLCDNLCDYIWLVTLTHVPELGDPGCLDQGTGIPAPQEYQRRIGLRERGGGEFTMYRNEGRQAAPLAESEDENMARVGVGAFRGADWTFAGEDSDIIPVPDNEFSYFFSGEGAF